MAKKAPKTYNHYVPQFYLRNFSGNNSIGAYNFDRKQFIDQTPISKVAGRDFLYGNDNNLENWFMEKEGTWATVINNVILREILPPNATDYTNLLIFTYLSNIRGAEEADNFKKQTLLQGKLLVRLMVAKGKINLSEEEIKNLDVEIDRPNLNKIKLLKDVIPIMSDLCPLLIVNGTQVGFITSDNPVVKYNQWFLERDYKHPSGYGQRGFQCFVPLSPKICFCLYDEHVYECKFSNIGSVKIYNDNIINELNKLFLHNAYREVYYEIGTRNWLEKIVSIKKEKGKNEFVFGSSQSGYFIRNSSHSVLDLVKLDMFKTRQFFKKVPLSNSDIVPLRRIAYDNLYKSD